MSTGFQRRQKLGWGCTLVKTRIWVTGEQMSRLETASKLLGLRRWSGEKYSTSSAIRAHPAPIPSFDILHAQQRNRSAGFALLKSTSSTILSPSCTHCLFQESSVLSTESPSLDLQYWEAAAVLCTHALLTVLRMPAVPCNLYCDSLAVHWTVDCVLCSSRAVAVNPHGFAFPELLRWRAPYLFFAALQCFGGSWACPCHTTP